MFIAYLDESGDRGVAGSQTYTIGCVMVEANAWPGVFDSLISFRRFVRLRFKVPVRMELKANYLVRGGGPLRPLRLPEAVRRVIFRQSLRLLPKLGLTTFAVLIRKPQLQARTPGADPRDIAWEFTLQRLERFSTKNGVPILIVHDEGDALLIRKFARKARRAGTAGSFFGTGNLRVPARLLLDDPVPRQSHQSYYIQMADMVAYAAFRHFIPPPALPAPRIHVVTAAMWDDLGTSRLLSVNALRGGQAGLVAWP